MQNNIELEYTGLDMPYQKDVNIKIKWIQRYFENHPENPDDKILLFLDAYDTILTPNFNIFKLIKIFKKHRCDILFSGENRHTKFRKNGSKTTFFDTEYTLIKDKLFYYGEKTITPNCGVMIGYNKPIKNYCKIIEENFEVKQNGITGDTIIFFKCLANDKFGDLRIRMDFKEKLFLTINNETFVRYSNYMKGGDSIKKIKDENTFKYNKLLEQNAMIFHITGINNNTCKNNVYTNLFQILYNNNDLDTSDSDSDSDSDSSKELITIPEILVAVEND